VRFMRAWTLSALNEYYSEPPVTFLSVGANTGVEPMIVTAGFYVTPHCDPECCEALGITILTMGPFLSASDARKWSRGNLMRGSPR
jgi:hypothetical protein